MTDEQARRALADQVEATVLAGSAAVALAAHMGQAEASGDAAAAMATAASAVVLASDLRAPILYARRDEDGYYPTKCADPTAECAAEIAAASADAQRVMATIPPPRAVRDFEAGMARAEHEDNREMHVSPNRQGWRARLANVERLLAQHFDGDDLAYQDRLDVSMRESLAEIRAMLDGQ